MEDKAAKEAPEDEDEAWARHFLSAFKGFLGIYRVKGMPSRDL